MTDVDPTMRTGMLQRALERRPAGRPVDALPPSTPDEAVQSAIAQLHEVLQSLDEVDWHAVAHHDIGTVRDVVSHLVGVERLAEAADESVVTNHIPASRAAADDLASLTTAELVATWQDAAIRALTAHVAAGNVRELVVHSFELWAHTLDICAATGRSMPDVDEPRLTLMSSRLMGALPFALTLRDVVPAASELRFVLTGAGGGCYDVALPGPGAALTIVADVHDLCRVAARRLRHDALEVTVEGDDLDAARIIGVLDAFARD